MTPPSYSFGNCRVVGAEKLPPDSGGAKAVCAAIQRAVAARAPGARFTVDVRVVSARALRATVRIADGRTLPEQELAVSDRALNGSSLERFAQRLAEQLAQAGRN